MIPLLPSSPAGLSLTSMSSIELAIRKQWSFFYNGMPSEEFILAVCKQCQEIPKATSRPKILVTEEVADVAKVHGVGQYHFIIKALAAHGRKKNPAKITGVAVTPTKRSLPAKSSHNIALIQHKIAWDTACDFNALYNTVAFDDHGAHINHIKAHSMIFAILSDSDRAVIEDIGRKL